MDLHGLIDLALATPQMGVVNLSILKSLLHIMVQQLKLDSCKVEFEGDPVKAAESIRSKLSDTTPLTINEYTADDNFIPECERRPNDKIEESDRDARLDNNKTEMEPLRRSSDSLPSIHVNSFETMPVNKEYGSDDESERRTRFQKKNSVQYAKDSKPEMAPMMRSIRSLGSICLRSSVALRGSIRAENAFDDELDCTNDTEINVRNSVEKIAESSFDAPEGSDGKYEMIQPITESSSSIGRNSLPLEVAKELIDNIIARATVDRSSSPEPRLTPSIEPGRSPSTEPRTTPSCVRIALSEMLVNVYNTADPHPDSFSAITEDDDDPFVRRSEIEELIGKIIANRLPPTTETGESTLPQDDVYKNIQKLLDESQLIDNKTTAYDIRQYFEQNVQHLCNKLERYIQSKIETENDSVNEVRRPVTAVEDAEIQTNPVPTVRNRQKESKSIGKQPNLMKPMESKRFCGGRHTLTIPGSRVVRKGNFEEQYCDLLSRQMKDELLRKKTPQADVYTFNSFNSVNMCNCYMDASDGFIICGTASRKRFE